MTTQTRVLPFICRDIRVRSWHAVTIRGGEFFWGTIKEVGIREFRERAPTHLTGGEPLAVHRDGGLVGSISRSSNGMKRRCGRLSMITERAWLNRVRPPDSPRRSLFPTRRLWPRGVTVSRLVFDASTLVDEGQRFRMFVRSGRVCRRQVDVGGALPGSRVVNHAHRALFRHAPRPEPGPNALLPPSCSWGV